MIGWYNGKIQRRFTRKSCRIHKKGHTHKEAAEMFGVCMKSIYIWNKMDKEGKRLVFEFVPRSPHRTDYEKLLTCVEEHPDTYLREIADHFSIGITTVWKALRRLGVQYKKRQIYHEADPEKRAKFIEFIEKQEKNNLVCVDESGIDKYLYRRNCRALKGEQVYEAISGRKFECVSIVAGKCGKRLSHRLVIPKLAILSCF